MYNIQLEHNYVILSSVIQLVSYMFQPLYLPIIRLYLAYRGLYYISSVSNGRRNLVYNVQVQYMNSINRRVPIFAIYMLCSVFQSVADIMFVYTLLSGEVAEWCRSVLLWLHCLGHGVADNSPCWCVEGSMLSMVWPDVHLWEVSIWTSYLLKVHNWKHLPRPTKDFWGVRE